MFDEIGLLVLEGDAAGLAAKVSELSATREQPALPVAVMPTPAPSTPEDPGVEEVSDLDEGRERHGAPAPLIHSRDS